MERLKEIINRGVLPGDDICIIEEFMPGIGSFSKNGVVRAAWIGVTAADLNTRTVHVKPVHKFPQLPERNSVVIGVVVLVKDEYAVIKIFEDLKGNRYLNGFTGVLHISQASDTHVKDLYEVIRVGDVVKAKVLNNNPPYNITIREPKLGVVLAFCGNCGSVLRKAGSNMLKCPKCGRMEKRKLSLDYGRV